MQQKNGMNGDDNASDHPTPDKTASRRSKANRMNRPRSASFAKSRRKPNQQQQQQEQPQQQRRGSRMREGGGGDRSNSGSSSAPQLHGEGSIAPGATNISNGDPPAATSNTNSYLQEEDGRRRLFEYSKTRGGTSTGGAVPQEALREDRASTDETQDAARLLQQLKSRNQEIETRRRQLEHRCTQLEG